MTRSPAVTFAVIALSVGSSLAAPISWRFNELEKRGNANSSTRKDSVVSPNLAAVPGGTSADAPIPAAPLPESETLAHHVAAYRVEVSPDDSPTPTRFLTQGELGRNIASFPGQPADAPIRADTRAQIGRRLEHHVAIYRAKRPPRP